MRTNTSFFLQLIAKFEAFYINVSYPRLVPGSTCSAATLVIDTGAGHRAAGGKLPHPIRVCRSTPFRSESELPLG